MSSASDDVLVRRLADYEKISGIVWIVIGILQICLIVTAIAGVWNIFAGITRLNASKLIAVRDPSVPEAFRSISPLVILGVVNLLLGAVFGIVMVALDFVIRDQILTNAHVFDGSSPLIEPTGTTLGNLALLEKLGALRAAGILTEAEFLAEKGKLLASRA